MFEQHFEYELCGIHNCQISGRHCETTEDNNNLDPIYHVHKQIWDATHLYFNHLFQLGLRQSVTEKEDDLEFEYDEDDVWKLTDNEMNR